MRTFNPVSYAVDALRTFVTGAGGSNPIMLDIAVLLVVLVVFLGLATALFNRTSI